MRKRLEILGWLISLLIVVVALAFDSRRSYLAGNEIRATGSLALALFLVTLFYRFRPKK